MRWKTTLVLLVATIAIGAYVSLVDLKQPTREEQEIHARQVAQIPPDDVTALAVKTSKGGVELAREGDHWRLTSPKPVRADDTLVRRILNELSPLTTQRVLEGSTGKPIKPEDYGLLPSLAAVTVTTPSRSTTLLLGRATATGGKRYAKLADRPTIYVIDGGLFDLIDQPVESFRSHDLLVFETWKAALIRAESAKGAYALAKQPSAGKGGPDRWMVTEPFQDIADAATVSTLLGHLRNLRIEHTVTDEPKPEDVPTWGFDHPFTHVVITAGDADRPVELFVGNPAAEHPEHRYAKAVQDSSVATVDEAAIAALLIDPFNLRSFACFELTPNLITAIEWTSGGASWTMKQANGQWMATEGSMTLDTQKANDAAWKLRDLKFVRLIEQQPPSLEPYGLASPAGRIRVWIGQDSTPQELLIGSRIGTTTARHGYLPARHLVVELPEEVERLSTTTPDSLQAKPQTAVPTPPPAPASP